MGSVMGFDAIDPILAAWTARRGLQLFTRFHDSEVRTVFLKGAGGERGQVWIDTPKANGDVIVRAAVYRKRWKDKQQIELSTDIKGLEVALERTYDIVTRWIKAV